MWIQQQIIGMPAHYTFVAVEGRMLAGFAGLPCSTTSATGPSTVVEFGPHPEMAEASRRMVAAMGATGFLSFDFMIETGTGTAYLLECNPRPNQVSHLGNRLGVDLCAALHDGLRAGASGTATAPLGPQRREIVALFPQEWLRMCDSPAIAACHHDVPWDDAKLVMRLTATASTSPLRQRRRLRVRVPIASAARALIRPIRARFDTAY